MYNSSKKIPYEISIYYNQKQVKQTTVDARQHLNIVRNR
jgi:hypothetical protein